MRLVTLDPSSEIICSSMPERFVARDSKWILAVDSAEGAQTTLDMNIQTGKHVFCCAFVLLLC